MGNSCPCCRKADDLADENKPVQKITIINERWQVHRQLGKGGCGKVYEVYDITDNNKPYAMKTEAVKNTETGRLPQEEKVISLIHEKGHGRHVTELLDRGMLQMDPRRPPTQFIVMTLLGPSLADLRKLCRNKRMAPGTTALLAIQMLESVEDIHNCGYIHRDIKPGNYMLGAGPRRHVVYIIDFGMARKYVDEDGKLLPIRKDNVRFRGTFRYAASETHKNVEYGRQHDLYCLLHTLAEMRMGELPWQEFEGDPTATYELKHKIIPTRWLSGVEPQYLAFYEHLTSLHYDIKPGYEILRGLFKDVLKNLKMTTGSPFEWEPNGENYHRFVKEELSRLFRDDIKT
uniref:non-specific serine/threonine protein kinase n=1 Tax=Romanomermis culicivorax TaxID=13658 RepID=A0A915J777_ROMCU